MDLEDGLLFFWKRIGGLGAGVVMMNMRSHGAVSVGFTSGTSERGSSIGTLCTQTQVSPTFNP